jgi:hypothetical protein
VEKYMIDDRALLREQKKQVLAGLKMTAIAAFERRGYEVRGKTPAQIRLVLKRRPTRLPSTA